MKEEKISINGIEINYKMAGEGEPLLILHGWGGSSDSWLEVQQILGTKGFKVIVLDLPGFGKSHSPPAPWEVKNYSDFVSDFIRKFGLENLIIIAHSFGGRIAIKFTSLHPENVKRLILCASGGIRTEPNLKERILFSLAWLGNILFSPKPLRRFKDRARIFLYRLARRHDYINAKGVMKETFRKVVAEDLTPCLHQIHVPTLIVWGEKDKMVPLKVAYIFKEKIPDSKLEIFPKIGHGIQFETPEKLAELVIKFSKT